MTDEYKYIKMTHKSTKAIKYCALNTRTNCLCVNNFDYNFDWYKQNSPYHTFEEVTKTEVMAYKQKKLLEQMNKLRERKEKIYSEDPTELIRINHYV